MRFCSEKFSGLLRYGRFFLTQTLFLLRKNYLQNWWIVDFLALEKSCHCLFFVTILKEAMTATPTLPVEEAAQEKHPLNPPKFFLFPREFLVYVMMGYPILWMPRLQGRGNDCRNLHERQNNFPMISFKDHSIYEHHPP